MGSVLCCKRGCCCSPCRHTCRHCCCDCLWCQEPDGASQPLNPPRDPEDPSGGITDAKENRLLADSIKKYKDNLERQSPFADPSMTTLDQGLSRYNDRLNNPNYQ